MRLTLEIIALTLVAFPAAYWWGRYRVTHSKWKPEVLAKGGNKLQVVITKRGRKDCIPIETLNFFDPEYEVNLKLAMERARDDAKEYNEIGV